MKHRSDILVKEPMRVVVTRIKPCETAYECEMLGGNIKILGCLL